MGKTLEFKNVTDRPTDGPTYQPTNTPSCRVACPRLKICYPWQAMAQLSQVPKTEYMENLISPLFFKKSNCMIRLFILIIKPR